MNLESVRPHVEILTYCRDRRKTLDEMEAESRAAIEEALGDNEIGELDGEEIITYKYVKSRRLNQKLLAQLYPEQKESCMDVTESRSFRVTS